MSAARKPSNRELRTRKDLLRATARLLKQGLQPTMEEVAAEAMISRATAYRYFRNVEALWVEATLDEAVADPAEVFGKSKSDDPLVRIDQAEASMHKMTCENEAQLRVLLANTIIRGRSGDGETVPLRQNRRLPLIEAALAPARDRFRDPDYERLCAALAVMFGPEAMIVFRDVLQVDEKTARKVKSWAVKALVQAALRPESA